MSPQVASEINDNILESKEELDQQEHFENLSDVNPENEEEEKENERLESEKNLGLGIN